MCQSYIAQIYLLSCICPRYTLIPVLSYLLHFHDMLISRYCNVYKVPFMTIFVHKCGIYQDDFSPSACQSRQLYPTCAWLAHLQLLTVANACTTTSCTYFLHSFQCILSATSSWHHLYSFFWQLVTMHCIANLHKLHKGKSAVLLRTYFTEFVLKAFSCAAHVPSVSFVRNPPGRFQICHLLGFLCKASMHGFFLQRIDFLIINFLPYHPLTFLSIQWPSHSVHLLESTPDYSVSTHARIYILALHTLLLLANLFHHLFKVDKA